MSNKCVKDILKYIQNNNIVSAKDIANSIKKESRYTQAFLDALEGVGLIEFERKATMKLFRLTERGRDFLEKN